MKAVSSRIYRLNPVLAIEDFGERSLALHCVDLRLVELNATARDLLSRLDGQASLRQVAASIADDYAQPLEAILADVQETAARMAELDIVEQVTTKGTKNTKNTILHVAKPDVLCREEDPDGALLLHPDTEEVLVVNSTGLLVWRALAEPRDQDGIVAALVEQCNNVPEDEVARDVGEFLEQLIAKGFVGVDQS